MITIKDVARRAGVSTATVSYVLNRKDRVSPDSERRVQRAIRDLGYTPSGTARKLKRGRSSVVGFVADNISNRFPARLVHGLAAEAASAGYSVLISDLRDDPANEARSLELLVHEQVEGIIYCGLGSAEEQLRRIHGSGTPVVVVDKPPRSPGLPSVLIDNLHGMELVLDHLFTLGHRRFAFISGDPRNPNTALRNRGFREFLRRHRLPVSGAPILMGSYSLAHGHTSALRLVDAHPGCTALVCGDDMIAFGAMAAFKSRGWRIPEDVAVAGFANDPLAGVMDPGLTTVHYPMVEMGRRAFAVFREVQGAGGLPTPHEVLPLQLVVRRSTDPRSPAFADDGLTNP